MDAESLEKWKQELENDRRDQLTKAKELQKETMMRRKAMEMKANLELAKEEKRRQEALAERKAAHIEATMRFQKGIKHFKMNKEKITIEDVMKKINPSRSRLNSADDKVIIYNNDLANYYCVSKQKPSSGSVKLRKSSSFDNLSKYTNKYETPAIYNKTPNNFNIIDHYNNTTSNNINQSNNNNPKNPTPNYSFNSNSNNTMISNSPTAITAQVPKSNRPVNFKEMLLENQKTIQDINKEALKDFQSLVSNELKKALVPNQEYAQNGTSNITNNSTNSNTINANNSNQHTTQLNYQNETTNSKKITSNNSKNEDDEEEDDESSDTMDTDSLLDDDRVEATDSSNLNKVNTANKINGENEEEPMVNSNSNFNLVKRFNFAQKSNDDDNDSINSKNGNTNAIDPFTFLTKRTNNLTTFFANNKNYLSNGVTSATKTMSATTATLIGYNMEQQNQENVNLSKKKQIKSILKRSSSLDQNLNVISMSNTNPVIVNFGIRTLENNKNNHVKDSIELANNRIISKKDLSDDNKKDKKSVRFAAQLSEDDSRITPNFHSNNTIQSSEPALTVNQIYNYQVQTQNKENEQQQAPLANINLSRISSTNSIRRPIIKPRTTPLKAKNISETLTQTKNESNVEANNMNSSNTNANLTPASNSNFSENLQLKIPKENSEKPPIYPGTIAVNNILSTGGYALLSQKRKEYLQRTKQNGAIITSPKTTPMSPTSMSPSLIMPIAVNTNTNSNGNNNSNMYNFDQSQAQQPPQIQSANNSANLNRAQLNSPLQFYSSSNSTSNKLPPKTSTTVITTPINSPNLDSNFNNGIFNYNNLKYNENSYRDYQIKQANNDTTLPNSGISYTAIINNNTSNINKFKPSNTDPNLYRYNDATSTLNNTDTTQLNQYTFTRIPLSPKSTLLKTNAYYNPNDKQISNSNLVNEGVSKRPFPTNGLISNTPVNANSNNSTSSNVDTGLYPSVNGIGFNANNQKTNGKFSYLSTNGNYNNTNTGNLSNTLHINGQSNQQLQQQPVQRVLSADSVSRQLKPNNSPTLHLEIKYPLYSNHQQAPTQYINISKPIRPNSGFEFNNEVGDSMANFLKVEEMSAKESTTESQILNQLQDFQSVRTQLKNIPINLSIEEQNVKNSIMRLNEKLNTLTTYNNRRYSNQEDQLTRPNYEALNRYKKPISASVLKNRR